MERERWKNAFERIEMSKEVKERIWEKLESGETPGEGRREKGGQKAFPDIVRHPGRWVIAAVMISFFLSAAVNLWTDGKIVKAIQELWKVEQNSQEIVEHTADYHVTLDGEFAPNLIECSEKRIVFASSIGLIVYDRILQQVVGTIDLQEIESYYFDDAPGETRFLMEGDKLTIYNREEATAVGKGYIVTGDCYVYDLAQCNSVESGEVKALKPMEVTPATNELQSRWRAEVKSFRKKTLSEYNGMEDIFMGLMYSKYSLQWTALDGKEYSSCLVITEEENTDTQAGEYQLMLYHKDLDTKEVKKETLELIADMPEKEEERLPEYEYTGNDLFVKALADCARDKWEVYCGYTYSLGTSYVPEFREEAVILPVIHIYQIKEGKKYIKLYGLFTYMDVVRHKAMLYDSDGASSGNRLACAYLEKASDGYKVKRIVHPLDGGGILEDMTALCGGDKKMAEKLVKHDCTKDRKEEELRLLKEYVEANHLDIQYYKSSADNPVKIAANP